VLHPAGTGLSWPLGRNGPVTNRDAGRGGFQGSGSVTPTMSPRQFGSLTWEQLQRQVTPDTDTCEIAWSVVQAAMNDLAATSSDPAI
jgi:hypothetical protein